MKVLSRIWKFYIISTALFTLLVAVAGFILQAELKKKLEAQVEGQVFGLATVLAKALPNEPDSPLLAAWCREYREAAAVRITLIKEDGIVLCDSSDEAITGENRLDRPEVYGAVTKGSATAVRYSNTLRVDMFYAAVFFKEKGEIIRLALPMTEAKAIENEVMMFFALVLYLVPLIAIGVSFFFVRYATIKSSHLIDDSRPTRRSA
jgi:two-component system phosphate regulon sensor histidine kinase PhoR